jgi:hypothetical protein
MSIKSSLWVQSSAWPTSSVEKVVPPPLRFAQGGQRFCLHVCAAKN